MPSAAEEAILGAAGSAGACVVSHPLDTARAGVVIASLCLLETLFGAMFSLCCCIGWARG